VIVSPKADHTTAQIKQMHGMTTYDHCILFHYMTRKVYSMTTTHESRKLGLRLILRLGSDYGSASDEY